MIKSPPNATNRSICQCVSPVLVETLPNIEDGVVLYDGKLLLPPLHPTWTQIASKNSTGSTFKGGDMGLWQRLACISFESIERTHRNTLRFNIEHPPNLWTTRSFKESEEHVSIFPYIQVSLISHEDADKLVKSVRADIDNILENIRSDIKSIFRQHGVPIDVNDEEMADEELRSRMDKILKDKWHDVPNVILEEMKNEWEETPEVMFTRLLNAIIPKTSPKLSQKDNNEIEKFVQKLDKSLDDGLTSRVLSILKAEWREENIWMLAKVIKAVVPKNFPNLSNEKNEQIKGFLQNIHEFFEDIEEGLSRVGKQFDQMGEVWTKIGKILALYSEGALSLFQNCVLSLGRMPPETGLLIGRMLYYVFGVSNGGKVDIQQLSSSYEGSYARVRTEFEPNRHNNRQGLVTNDYILILATKSDFCLIHAHIPLLSSEMFLLDIDAQNWIKNVRMTRLR